MKLKNLIFDLGGVIATLDPDEAYRRFQQLGIADARERMGIYGQTGFFRQVETGEIDADRFCELLAGEAQRQTGAPRPHYDFRKAQWAWMGYILDVPQQRLDTLLELRTRFKVFLLSNTNPFIWEWASSPRFSASGRPITDFFDACYCSYRMNDYKPSPTIFQAMLADAGIQAAESVFLDDGRRNVAAAESVGIRGLLVPENKDWAPALMQLIHQTENRTEEI